MIPLEQKSVRWMMDLVAVLFDQGHLVVHFCARRMAGAKEFLLLCDHQCFVGCKIDEAFVKEASPGLDERLRVTSTYL